VTRDLGVRSRYSLECQMLVLPFSKPKNWAELGCLDRTCCFLVPKSDDLRTPKVISSASLLPGSCRNNLSKARSSYAMFSRGWLVRPSGRNIAGGCSQPASSRMRLISVTRREGEA
jgi:hypothetical protein